MTSHFRAKCEWCGVERSSPNLITAPEYKFGPKKYLCGTCFEKFLKDTKKEKSAKAPLAQPFYIECQVFTRDLISFVDERMTTHKQFHDILANALNLGDLSFSERLAALERLYLNIQIKPDDYGKSYNNPGDLTVGDFKREDHNSGDRSPEVQPIRDVGDLHRERSRHRVRPSRGWEKDSRRKRKTENG